MKRKILLALGLVLALTLCVSAALAENQAKIGTTVYATFDEAVAAAKDGETVELLTDATTVNGIGIGGKTLTIDGKGHKLNFNTYGIYLAKGTVPAVLTFENCDIVMNPVQGTPTVWGERYSWAEIVINFDCVLNLKKSTFQMEGGDGLPGTGVYYHEGSKVNLDQSSMVVKNMKSNAFSADVKDEGKVYTSELNVLNGSRLETSGCYAGLTAALQITVDASTLINSNQRGNASNGADYYISNGSVVDISGNGSNGMSARHITVSNSTLTCNNNGLRGIIFYGKGEFLNSQVTITGTKGKSYWCAGMRLSSSSATGFVDKKTRMTIRDNPVTGLFLDAGAQFTVEEGADVLITCNHAEQANCTTEKELARKGGGIVVRSSAEAVLSVSTKLYNNHAKLMGDDIYVEDGGTITFGKTGENWKLDGGPDCYGAIHAIDGWYEDGENNKGLRWNADAEDVADRYIHWYDCGTYQGTLALKAAHDVIPESVVPEEPEVPVEPVTPPQTGDNSTPLAWLCALLACAACLTVLRFSRKRRA